MNEVLNVISKRYSCRDFKEARLSDDTLKAIAKAAIESPSARNIQPWRVIVVKDEELIRDLENEGMKNLAKQEDKTLYNNVIKRGGKMFYNAPSMIVIPIDSKKNYYSLIDCGILCQTITLAATSLGVANVICGMTGFAFQDSDNAKMFKERLGFPEGYEFGCSVLLGYANTKKEPHDPDEEKISYV